LYLIIENLKQIELRFIHQEIGLLRDENHHQNIEIALLKEKFGSTKDSNDDRRMAATSLDDNHRNKRPVRLLPPHILYGDRKNETEKQQQINRRRYEEPTGCSDLSILDYTLNGFYQVKSNESTTKSTSNEINLETVFCAFKQPEGTYNSALIEKRIISRRKNSSKLSSNMIFHAKRGTDLKATDRQVFNITFDEVLLDPGNSFDVPVHSFTDAGTRTTVILRV